MALQEFPCVLWADSSSYFLTANLSKILNLVSKTGAALLTTTFHSNFAVTHGDMYKYLPTEKAIALQTQRQAGIAMYCRSNAVIKHILRWYVYCALDERCIAPVSKKDCVLKGTDSFTTYVDCHRYDQSAINIILNNYYHYCNQSFFTSVSQLQKRVSYLPFFRSAKFA